jgi:hypothetical protein
MYPDLRVCQADVPHPLGLNIQIETPAGAFYGNTGFPSTSVRGPVIERVQAGMGKAVETGEPSLRVYVDPHVT